MNAKRKVRVNPLKLDPTRTATLRRQFSQELSKRFDKIALAILDLIWKQDAFGLDPARRMIGMIAESNRVLNANPESCNQFTGPDESQDDTDEDAKELFGPLTTFDATLNTRWAGIEGAEKVKAFENWLKNLFATEVIGKTEEELFARYIKEGFEKGASRAFDDAKPKAVAAQSSGNLDFYEGNKDQFLKSSFAQPVAVDKVKLLAGRSFTDLKNVTSDMSTKMVRVLTDGFVQGKGPKQIASDLVKVVGLSKTRALLIARTEVVRSHAEGQLLALENLGVEEVGVAVEWSTTGDGKVCSLCKPLQGVILKLDEAKGLIPRHPNCRCAWVPSGLGESTVGKKVKSKKAIDRTIALSRKRGGKKDTFAAKKKIASKRPEPLINTGQTSPSSIPYTQTVAIFQRAWDPLLSVLDPVINANPEGCNQYTGPGCAVGTKGGECKGEGTAESPMRCGGNLDAAVKALAEGKHIRLKQPDQVSTLIDELHKEVQRMKEAGENAPTFDLCKVTVKNTNLFCQETKGFPRAQMPQMRGLPLVGTYADTLPRNKAGKVDISNEFIAELESKGVRVIQEKVKASHLRASQSEIDGARVAELVKAAESGEKDLRKRPIFVTKDNYVVDGHHHWAALIGVGAKADKDLKVPVYRLDTDIGTAIAMANKFAKERGIAPKTVGPATLNERFIRDIPPPLLQGQTPVSAKPVITSTADYEEAMEEHARVQANAVHAVMSLQTLDDFLRTDNGSFFATCLRDKKGHCTSGVGSVGEPGGSKGVLVSGPKAVLVSKPSTAEVKDVGPESIQKPRKSKAEIQIGTRQSYIWDKNRFIKMEDADIEADIKAQEKTIASTRLLFTKTLDYTGPAYGNAAEVQRLQNDIKDHELEIGQAKGILADRARIREDAKTLFPPNERGLSDIASAVGAPDDAKVSLQRGGKGYVAIYIDHLDYKARRTASLDKDGKKVMHNDSFFIEEHAQGSGLGTKILTDQVANLKEQGFDRIETWAAKGPGINGYYTWARLGYDQPISAFRDKRTRDRILKAYPEAKSVQDVMKTEEGRAWWSKNGANMRNAVFDLNDGSRSLKVLSAYLEERKNRKGKSGATQNVVFNELPDDYVPESDNEDDIPPPLQEAEEPGPLDYDTLEVSETTANIFGFGKKAVSAPTPAGKAGTCTPGHTQARDGCIPAGETSGAKPETAQVPKSVLVARIAARKEEESKAEDKSKPVEKPGNKPGQKPGDRRAELETMTIKSVKPLGGGVNASSVIEMEDGSKAVFKPSEGEKPGVRKAIKGDYAVREALSSQVADTLGMSDLHPPTVLREVEGKTGSVQGFVKNAATATHVWNEEDIKNQKHVFDGDKDLSRAAAFDFLTGQVDRHRGNWMLSGDPSKPQTRNLVLIDNGLSFPDTHSNTGFVHSKFLRGAANKKLVVPREVAEWKGKEKEIQSHLEKSGLSKTEQELTMARFRILVSAAERGLTFGDMQKSSGVHLFDEAMKPD